ncbi:hypothetical protein [Phocaeicola faecium]|uniref:Uncharacterized protein n=1 Tax=Phocaeicola faecium TaxID=2762213 RepID=A0ABR8V766_9BACT|nr:hypothetical protein [Phocaeicola faecium]MBD8000624.1 hypothetical protein [Phocaeicola faecium]
MNKAITSFWKRLFFRYDVSRMRKVVVDYLTTEGIQAEVKDGMIQVLFEDYYYNVEFDLEGEYPRCDISFRMKDEMYEKLDLPRKTFIADKVNTDEERLSTLKAFGDVLIVDAHFYFANRKMLLSLFYDYFADVKHAVDDMCDLLQNELSGKEEKRPIGFTASPVPSSKEEAKVVACNKQTE